MEVMGTAVKVLIGLVLVLPMTAYVAGSLVAAADEPVQHQPIIVQQTKTPDNPGQSPSGKPTEKPGDKKSAHEQHHGKGGDDDPPEIITPSPSDLFDDNGGAEDNSGKGSGDG